MRRCSGCLLQLLVLSVASGSYLTPVDQLLDCLHSADLLVLSSTDGVEYEKERQCRNRKVDSVPTPVAIVRPANALEVGAAVGCAATVRIEVCARSGGHGSDNDAGCSGGLLVDVQRLLSLSVRAAGAGASEVTFGAGFTLGQLYYRLVTEHGLMVAGGTVSGVGAAGLFLGCGRGFFSTIEGLACDNVLSIEYVDATGSVRTADENSNAEMLWMARGGGGEFPAIVTRFTVRGFAAPTSLGIDCSVPLSNATALLSGWLSKINVLMSPARRVYSSVASGEGSERLEWTNICFGCTPSQREWLSEQVETIAAAAGVGSGGCTEYRRSVLQLVLRDSGVGSAEPDGRPLIGDELKALLDREQGHGSQDGYAFKTGSHMMDADELEEMETVQALIRTLIHETHERRTGVPRGSSFMLYPVGGRRVQSVGASETAYAHRRAQLVVHYKHAWPAANRQLAQEMVAHHVHFGKALGGVLSCSGFYNYIDNDMPCARNSNEAWLAAYFGNNVLRMMAVRTANDPRGIFRGPPLDAAYTTMWMEKNLSLAVKAKRSTLYLLSKGTWNESAMKENIGHRRAGTSEVSVLSTGWAEEMGRVAAALNGTAVAGVFLGDEIVCRGVPLSNWSSVASALRAGLDSSIFISANECHGIHYTRGVTHGAHWVPRHIDVISVDLYAMNSDVEAADEASGTRAYYEEWIFPSLHPNQRASVVPGTFGPPNASIAELDANLTAKLRGYANWTRAEPRIVGLASWHWDDLISPLLPFKYQRGGCSLPRLRKEVAAWRARIQPS